MASTTHEKMHLDHLAWTNEGCFWHDAVRTWQKDVEVALKEIARVEQALRDHEKELEIHAAAIKLYGQKVGEHEHAIAQFEKGGAGEDLPELAGGHAGEEGHQRQQRETHERLKQKHHVIMAYWKLLSRALSDEM